MHLSELHKEQTATWGKKKKIATAQTPIRVYIFPKERGISSYPWQPNAMAQHLLVGGKYQQCRSVEPEEGILSLYYITLSSVKPWLSSLGLVLCNNPLMNWITFLSRGSWGCLVNSGKGNSFLQTYKTSTWVLGDVQIFYPVTLGPYHAFTPSFRERKWPTHWFQPRSSRGIPCQASVGVEVLGSVKAQ